MTVYGHSMHERWSRGNHRPSQARWLDVSSSPYGGILGYFEKIIGFLELFEFQ